MVGFVAGLALGCLPASRGAAQGLGDLYRVTDGVSDSHVEYHELNVAKGGQIVLTDLKGPGKITYWYITDDSEGKWYPGLVLKVYWDGRPEPSVNVPIADFFGAMRGKTIDYQSAPMQINHLSYMCYLPMPFSTGARFVLANDGDRDYRRNVAYGIDYEKDQKYAGEKSRLHCAWRRSNPTEHGMHTILEAAGRGHYVGNFLQVHTRHAGWWGEGDTIFHIDGKKITHSPGTEDEYGACWFGDFGFKYANMYSGYLQNELRGDSRMYRWYLANPVRFQQSLKVEIQNQHENGTPTGTADADDYTTVGFWYQESLHRGVSLQSFVERTAPSRAGGGKK